MAPKTTCIIQLKIHARNFFILYFSAMHWIVSKEPAAPQLPVPYIEDLIMTDAYTKATDKIQWLKSQLVISKERIKQV